MTSPIDLQKRELPAAIAASAALPVAVAAVEDVKVDAPSAAVEDMKVHVPSATAPAAEKPAAFAALSALAKAFSQEHLISLGAASAANPRAGSIFASRLALASSVIVLVAAALGMVFARRRAKAARGKAAKATAEGSVAEQQALLAGEIGDAPPMGMMRGLQRAPKRGYGANTRL